MKLRLHTLSPRSRAIAAAAMIPPVILLAAAIWLGVETMAVWRTTERAETYLAQARENPQAARRSQALWIKASSPALAAAAFEQTLSEIFAANQLTLTSMEVLPGDGDTVSVEVAMTGRLAGLRRALFSLETGTPLVFVRKLSIEKAAALPAEAPEGAPVPLSVRATLEAHYRPEAAP